MSSLSPFVSNQTRRLAPSNIQVLIEHMARLPDGQFKAMARRVQWDEIVIAPQSMQIDGEEQVINKQVLSPVHYAITALSADRLEWLLPHALATTRKQSRYFRNDEGLVHANGLVDTLLPAAMATTDKKKVDIVLAQATPDDNHQIMRMSMDGKAAAATEAITPDDMLFRIPAIVRHLASRVHEKILQDPMFRNRPRDAKRLSDSVRKNFMTAFAERGRLVALQAAYPGNRRVPLMVWVGALSHGGLVNWCTDKIDSISTPSIPERRESNDWVQEIQCPAAELVFQASFQSQEVNKTEFITPKQRAEQAQWTHRAIEVMAQKWIENGMPAKAREHLWSAIPRLLPEARDALVQCLVRVHAKRPENFAEDWGSPAGEMSTWVRLGQHDTALARSLAFPGTMPRAQAMRLSSEMCQNWYNLSNKPTSSAEDAPSVFSLEKQAQLHKAWGIAPTVTDLLGDDAKEWAEPAILAKLEQFLLGHHTVLAPSAPAPRRM